MCRSCNLAATRGLGDWKIEVKGFDRQPLTQQFLNEQLMLFNAHYYGYQNDTDFKRWLRYRITGESAEDRRKQVESLTSCRDCGNWILGDNANKIKLATSIYGSAARPVCDRCRTDYKQCVDCQGYVGRYYRTNKDGDTYCRTCAGQRWATCGLCSGSYEKDQEHHCKKACCGPIPEWAKTFTLAGLSNDTLVTVEPEAGKLNDGTIRLVAEHVSDWSYRERFNLTEKERASYASLYRAIRDYRIEAEWKTARGLYATRVKSYAYKEFGLKLPKDLLTKIGNAASSGSNRNNTYRIEFTRRLDLSPTQFGNASSCWWTNHEYRCALKSKGGFGMRDFDEKGQVAGRVWVMGIKFTEDKYRPLQWTTDIENADAFIVFNGYGTLTEHRGAHALATFLGWKYKKVRWITDMYTNGDGAYIVTRDLDAFPTGNGFTTTMELNNAKHTWIYPATAPVAQPALV